MLKTAFVLDVRDAPAKGARHFEQFLKTGKPAAKI